MDTLLRLMPLALLLAVSACTCQDDPQPPERTPQAARAQADEAFKELFPVPPGDLVPTLKLAELLPQEIAGFTATRALEKRETPIANGGILHVVHKDYENDAGLKMSIELNDSLQAPAVKKIIEHQHAAERPAAARIKARTIHGYPALAQYGEKDKTAFVNVLVNQRFLINVKTVGGSGFDEAMAVAEAMDYGGIAELGGEPGPATGAELAAPDASAAAQAAAPTPDPATAKGSTPAAANKQ